jgi:rhodanese-related sulfurtransferase
MPIPQITVVEAHARLAAAPAPRLIDVREQDEWDLCHLADAELFPLSSFGELAAQRLTNPAEPLLIYCHHGGRSAQVTAYLIQSGFTDVTNVAGGIDAWALEIDPTIPRY